MLDKFNPARRATGHHGQNAFIGHTIDQLGGFFHDSQVGGKTRIEYTLKAESTQRGHHFAVDIRAGLAIESFPKRYRDRGSVLHDHDFVGICKRFHDLFHMRLLGERAGRTCQNTLSAIDTAGKIETALECRSHTCRAAAIHEINSRNALHLFTDANAFAAKNAFFGVPDKRRAARIERHARTLSDKPTLTNAKIVRKALKLAVAVARAVQAIIRVIRQKQLYDRFAGSDSARRMSLYFHALGDRKRATRRQAPLSFHFNYAYPACAAGRKPVDMTQRRYSFSGSLVLSET